MVKIKDVAELAKVSPATVSRILNDDKTLSVRPETKQAVIAAADKLGYVSKNSKANKKILHFAIVQWISYEDEENDLYYHSVRRAIENYCIYSNVTYTKFYEENFNNLFYQNDVDGVICIGKFTEVQVKKISEYSEHIIFVDSNPDSVKFSSVQHDLSSATLSVLDYLEECGHSRIGFIGGHEPNTVDKYLYEDIREITFLKQRELRNLKTKDSDIYFGYFDATTGYESIMEASKTGDLPTAFICASDSIAIGALSAISELNLDLSIISFNNVSTANFLNPPLTTVDLNTKYMGEVAVTMMIYMIRNNIIQPFNFSISTELIVRNSVMKI